MNESKERPSAPASGPASPAEGRARTAPLWRQLSLAAHVLLALRRGHSGTAALAEVSAELRPGVQAIAYTVWRHLGAAQALRHQLAARAPTPPVDALLCCALALDVAGADYDRHTLVNQAVEAAKRAPATRLQAAFINACLRRYLRERATLHQAVADDPLARWNHPAWWVQRLQADWPAHWMDLLAQANTVPPMTLRVNRRALSRDAYGAELRRVGLDARAVGPDALALVQPCAVQDLPGFDRGWVSVQDAAAQRAAPLLLQHLAPAAARAPRPRVLDACSAPGGKTAHLLECADLDLTALDVDGQRLASVRANLQRLRLHAHLRAADAGDTQRWWDGVPFDAILLDAPCSASGIVRRHPDIRWLRRESDLAGLARQQARLLDKLWPTLRPGGCLVYATCSLFRAEGQLGVDAFLQRQADALRLPDPGHQLPQVGADGAPAADGFFYAVLRKAGGCNGA